MTNISDTTSAKTYYDRGQAYYKNYEYEKAYNSFCKAVELEPNNPEYLARFAMSCSAVDEDEKAFDLANKALKINPNCVMAYRARAKANYWGKDSIDAALADVNRAISLDNTNHEIYEERGFLYANVEKFDLCYKDFMLALKLNPNSSNAYRGLSFMYTQSKQYQEALKAIEKSIQLDRNNVDAYSARAMVNFCLERFEATIPDLTFAIQKQGRKVGGMYYLRSIAYNQTHNYELALIDRAKHYELMPKKQEELDPNYAYWAEKIHRHFVQRLLPKLKSTGEKLIEYYPTMMLWNTKENMSIYGGRSSTYVYGSYGTGYICFSSRYIYIFSDGELSQRFPLIQKSTGKGILRFALGLATGSYIPDGDKRNVEKTDQEWAIPNPTITGGQIVENRISLVTTAMQWDLFPAPDSLVEIQTAINMAITNRFEQIWAQPTQLPTVGSAQPKEEKDVMTMIRELAKLRAEGIISDDEFETKKKELLTRL